MALAIRHEAEAPQGFIPQPYEFHSPDKLGPVLALGDFAGLDYDTILTIVNRAAEMSLKASLDNPSRETNRRVRDLKQQLMLVQDFVKDDSHYTEGAVQIIADRHQQADRATEGKPMIERIAKRVKGHQRHFAADMDRTITEDDSTPNNRFGYLMSIPGSAVAEPTMARQGRETFIQVFAQVWQPILKQAPALFEQAGKNVPIRPGVNNCFGYLKNRGDAITILSANFEPFVHAVLDRIPNAENIPVFSVSHNNVVAVDKGTLLTHLAKRTPHQALFYAGDGSSDIPALEAAPLIAGFFALEGSSFEQALKEKGVPYLSYRDFNDITLQLAQIDNLASPHYN